MAEIYVQAPGDEGSVPVNLPSWPDSSGTGELGAPPVEPEAVPVEPEAAPETQVLDVRITRDSRDHQPDELGIAPVESDDVGLLEDVDPSDGDWVLEVHGPQANARELAAHSSAAGVMVEKGIDPRNLAGDVEDFSRVQKVWADMWQPYQIVAREIGNITAAGVRDANNEAGNAIAKALWGTAQGFLDVTAEMADVLAGLGHEKGDEWNLWLLWDDDGIRLVDERPADYEPIVIPKFFTEPETEVGQMGAGILQFIFAMGATSMGTLGTIPFTAGRFMSYGAVADALFDPEEGNFSTMLMDLGVEPNAVLEFLGTPVGDDADAAERLGQRLKTALEGGLIGLPFDLAPLLAPLLFKAIRALKENPAMSKAVRHLREFAVGGVRTAQQRYAAGKSPIPMGMSIEDVGPSVVTAARSIEEVRADTRQGAEIVAERLDVLIPESNRVWGGKTYRPRQPEYLGGRPWSELDAEELVAPGPGFKGSDEDIDRLLKEAIEESSAAARTAASETGMTVTLRAKDWDAALRLPLRAQLWYELSGEAFARRIPYLQRNPDEFITFTDIVGVTSPRNKPLDNLQRSMAILSQRIRGVPIDVDLTNPTGVQQALGRHGGGTSVGSGNKTGNFSDTLALAGGADVPVPIPVNDIWVGRIFGVTDEQLMQYQSLHEPMAIFWNKMRDLVNETAPAQFPHESWQLQARGWVSLRGEQSDYAQAMDTIVDQLNAANIPGVTPEGVITEEALRHPDFVTTLRSTVQAYRDAPKATIEFGTKQTKTGARAAELVEQIHGRPDDEKAQALYRDYNQILTSAMYRSGRGKRNMWDRAYNHVMGLPPGADVTRIRAPTAGRPFDIAGTFEGAFSPNIRVPLRDMSDDQVALFNAIIGKGLRQDAMAASRIKTIAADAEVAPGTVRGQSVFIDAADDLDGGEIEEFYRALPDGFEISTERVPNGYMIDINPRFGDEGPVGITDAEINPALRSLATRGLAFDTLYHQYSSVYNEASEYAGILAARKKELRDGAVNELVERTSLTRSQARGFLRGNEPGPGTKSEQGTAGRIRSTLTGRLGDLDETIAAARETSQGVEAKVKDWISTADEHLSMSNREGRPPDIDAPTGNPETAPPRAGLSNEAADPEAVLEQHSAYEVSVMADVENLPGREMWSKAFAKAVDREASRLSSDKARGQSTREHIRDNYDGFTGAIVRANLEAIPRHFKKLGWTVRHASTSRGGRKSSRYLVSPDVSHSPDLNQERFEVRLSDHILERPDDWHGESWNFEIIVTGAGNESPKSLVDQILNVYRTEHLHD